MEISALEFAPDADRTGTPAGEHFVQFYQGDEFLLAAVRRFVDEGLWAGNAVLVVATREHATALRAALEAYGFDLAGAELAGSFQTLDAAELLSTFMVGTFPDERRFMQVVGEIVARAGRDGRRVRIFGEMVALLAAEGNYEAALQIERLWNRLGEVHPFLLFCGYHLDQLQGETLTAICAEHAHVIPAENYSSLSTAGERLRAIVELQQQAGALATERKAAEERFRFLAESLPQKVFTALASGAVDYCNAQWTEYTGFRCEAMEDWGWTEVIHPHDLDELLRQWQHSLTTGEPFQFEHRLRRADGVYRWHLTRAHAMRAADGTILMWVGSHTDIDEQKRREALLARSIRQRDEFLSAISHDLKTPLTVLRGQAQILQRRIARGGFDPGVLARGLEQIESRSRAMAKMVDELLDVTRLRAGEEFKLELQPVDLVALVQEVVSLHIEATDTHQLIFRSDLPELKGWWDGMQLRRVVENLVSNAIQYSPGGGEITLSLAVEAGPQGEHALLCVQDRGIGIPEDDLPQIFERFYRGRNARSGTVGTGLGLAAVRRIVEQHGGVISVSSEEWVGSTFTVRLPLAPPAPGAG